MVDALVVGAGPVGLTMAMLLQAQGFSVRIVEKRAGPQQSPAAHVINARTFEIWRQLGLDVDKIRSHAQTPEDAGRVYWVNSLGGEIFGSLQYEQQDDDQLVNTPTPLRNLSQHLLEPLLCRELENRGLHVEYGCEWTTDNSDFTATWILACDGASSSVRRASGIEMIGPDNLQQFLNIHFRADFSSVTGQLGGILYWVCGPGSGTFISHGNGGEWVYMSQFQPGDNDLSTEEIRDRVLTAVSLPDATIDVLSVSSWVMTSQIAATFTKGNMFLVGDSAHRFPPSGGMGLNTGIGDAHNLAWKLGAVKRGECGSDILASYESERRPIAERNANASLDNAFRMIEVFQALEDKDHTGLDSAIAHQATHFDMLGLQIGYRYILTDSDPELEPLSDELIRTFHPGARVGTRLSHGWLVRDGQKISSLDLVALNSTLTIGGPGSHRGDTMLRVGEDFDDPDNWWGKTLGLDDDQVIVVRPDQHIQTIS